MLCQNAAQHGRVAQLCIAKWAADVFADRLRDRGAPERRTQPRRRGIGADRSAFDVLPGCCGQQHLQQGDHVVVVGIGAVHLKRGLLARGAFFGLHENAIELEDLLDAADQQPLQITLRRTAQVKLVVEGVMVRGELRRRRVRCRLQDRRLDFDIRPGRKRGAQTFDQPPADIEDMTGSSAL